MRRLVLLLVLAGLVALSVPVPATADNGAGGDNAAVAINTKDGSSLFRLAFKIRRVAGEIVDNTNAAVAFSSCTSCETTAIAIQIVLATGDPDTVTPENFAIAINQECTLCETFASAYQFVLSTGGPVRFTAEGNRTIAQIRRELQALRKENDELAPAELDARVSALVDRLRVVLAEELVPAGRPPPERPTEPSPTTGQDGTQTQTAPTESEPTTTTTETETGTETVPTTTETTP